MATETIRTGPHDGPARRSRTRVVVGASLLAAGVVLLAATSGYYLYGKFSRSTLDDLGFEIARPRFAGEGYVQPASAGTGAQVRTAPRTEAVAPREPQSTSADGGMQSGNAPQAAAQAAAGTAAGISAGGTTGDPASPGTSAASRGIASGQTSDAPGEAPSGSSQIGAGTGAESFGQTEDSDGTSQTVRAPAVVATAMPSANVSRTPSSSVTARTTPAAGTDSPDTQRYTSLDTEPTPAPGAARPAEPDPRLAAMEASIAEVRTYSVPTPEDLASAGALATRIRIPAIEVDAVIDELRIRQLGDSLAWETPKKVVGHIPATAKAGAAGQGWYFGHLESPLRGEGNVFARLPEIPELAAGAPIFIFLETADRHYAYQVYVTEVVHEDEIALSDSGEHDITLVTCTPRFYYDHRLLVTAALVGIREA